MNGISDSDKLLIPYFSGYDRSSETLLNFTDALASVKGLVAFSRVDVRPPA